MGRAFTPLALIRPPGTFSRAREKGKLARAHVSALAPVRTQILRSLGYRAYGRARGSNMLGVSRSRRSALVFIASLMGTASFSTLAGTDLPGQPYASYWFPSTILDWDPATDPDAPFNRSSIPLAARFSNPDFNVNPHAHIDEARVQPLVAF